MLSTRTKLCRSVKKFSGFAEIDDIILFGSAQRGKEDPADIDVLVVFRTKVSKRLEQEIRRSCNVAGLEINSTTRQELESDGFIAREGVYLEGYSLIKRKKKSDLLGLQKPTGNDYYRYFMDINFMLLGWKQVEQVVDGKKYKGELGELSIFIKPYIETDWGGKWAKHWLLKHIHPFFENRIYKQDMLQREDLLLQQTYRLQGTIKKFLEQKLFISEREILYEPRRKFG
jgi:predicted nucleotidyltransferase